ncbi:single-stranded DNA-binding protein [Candidatus Pacearchaeota archaeon]|nr:single-stranded DNA-binding protein [Candidatus Pacearchaeota archaeon]
MPSFNNVVLVGHLSKVPELKWLESNTAVCNFGIAVNDNYKNSAGKKIEKVCFIDCSCFGKRGEAIHKYLDKGDPVLITGKLVLESWEKDDVKHYKHKVQVREFSFIGSKKATNTNENADVSVDSDDIPF